MNPATNPMRMMILDRVHQNRSRILILSSRILNGIKMSKINHSNFDTEPAFGSMIEFKILKFTNQSDFIFHSCGNSYFLKTMNLYSRTNTECLKAAISLNSVI